jgi:hypothetical protein
MKIKMMKSHYSFILKSEKCNIITAGYSNYIESRKEDILINIAEF